MTFRSSSQAATCPSVYHTRWRLHTVPLIAERQAGKLWIPIFIVFGLTRPGIEPVSTASVADALSTRPLIGFGTKKLTLIYNLSHQYRIHHFSKTKIWKWRHQQFQSKSFYTKIFILLKINYYSNFCSSTTFGLDVGQYRLFDTRWRTLKAKKGGSPTSKTWGFFLVA